MFTEEDQKKYRIAIRGLRDQRRILYIRQRELEKKFFPEIKRIEEGLAKNKEMEEELLEEMQGIGKLPF